MMTSERKILANRLNARKSRGPRTGVAKARVSGNALRHGLAALTHVDPTRKHEVEIIARAICGSCSNPFLFEQALVIAESQSILRCVSKERVAVIERFRNVDVLPFGKRGRLAWAKLTFQQAQWAAAEIARIETRAAAMAGTPGRTTEKPQRVNLKRNSSVPERDRDEFEAMQCAMPFLERLARYERRAWARRGRALRNFMEIKSKSASANLAETAT